MRILRVVFHVGEEEKTSMTENEDLEISERKTLNLLIGGHLLNLLQSPKIRPSDSRFRICSVSSILDFVHVNMIQ